MATKKFYVGYSATMVVELDEEDLIGRSNEDIADMAIERAEWDGMEGDADFVMDAETDEMIWD